MTRYLYPFHLLGMVIQSFKKWGYASSYWIESLKHFLYPNELDQDLASMACLQSLDYQMKLEL